MVSSVQKQVFRIDDNGHESKSFFLITGSDLLFNKLDEIEHEYFLSLSPRENIQSDNDFKRYPVLSLKWLLYRFKGLSL